MLSKNVRSENICHQIGFIMSEYLEVIGGAQLSGEVTVGGAKNAVLPMLIASLLTSDVCEFSNVPDLEDVLITSHLLKDFGGIVTRNNNILKVQVQSLKATEASYSLVKAMRASFWVLGPLLARGGAARVALPGGDMIGARPVDLHIAALTQMGAEIKVKHGVVYATAENGLKPADIELKFPSVGATHQVLLAASLTPGVTTIKGAACEPEVVALAEMLNQMGAEITGAGTPDITIKGKETLHGAKVSLIGDRIEAASFILACAITGGKVKVSGFKPAYLGEFLNVIESMGVGLELGEDFVIVSSTGKLKAVNVVTKPYPGFATDIQAPLLAALTYAEGTSQITESIFEARFRNSTELSRMGANISVMGNQASITGVSSMSGADVEAFDIRAAAALAIAGLKAEGMTRIFETHHLRRGYDNFDLKLRNLGARVFYRDDTTEDRLVGC